ncbi:Protein translocase subunit SecD [Trichinella pseudospiralis]
MLLSDIKPLSGKLDDSWKRGPEITPPAFLTHPITFWDGKSPTGMPGGEIPLQCFLLISSHLGKISHQGDCGGANICSYTFCLSHDILGQLITKRNAGREIAVVLISAPVFLLIPSHFGTVSHKEECGAVNLPSCASC